MGTQRSAGETRQHPQDQPTDDEQNGIRNENLLCERRQRQHRRQQQDDRLKLMEALHPSSFLEARW